LQTLPLYPPLSDLAASARLKAPFSGDPNFDQSLQPADWHRSVVQVDEFGTPQSFQFKTELEFLAQK